MAPQRFRFVVVVTMGTALVLMGLRRSLLVAAPEVAAAITWPTPPEDPS